MNIRVKSAFDIEKLIYLVEADSKEFAESG
jgi:hypothetical protein